MLYQRQFYAGIIDQKQKTRLLNTDILVAVILYALIRLVHDIFLDSVLYAGNHGKHGIYLVLQKEVL